MKRKSFPITASVAASMMTAFLVLAFTCVAHAGDTKYKVGDNIANFTLKDDKGKSVSLADYRGKVIILNFYASW